MSSHGLTKADLLKELSSKTGLTQVQLEKVLDAMEEVTRKELKSKGVINILPGLVKVTKERAKAKPARDGRNPRTGETIRISAKPAHDVVKIKALSGLKSMV